MPREHFDLDWAFGLRGFIENIVKQNFRSDLHRWPLLQTFHVETYQATEKLRVFIFNDKSPSSAVPSISSGSDAKPWPSDAPSIPQTLAPAEIPSLLGHMYEYFKLSLHDAAFVVPVAEGANLDDDWNRYWTDEMKAVLYTQLNEVVQRQLHFVRGFDLVGKFTLPPGYEFLAKECERFFLDYPGYDRNVFLMTRFDISSRFLVELDVELRKTLRESGFNPVRADDKMYMADRNLWNNVCVYMLCCSKGIAILEDRARDEFNPNVALEYGFMRALNKPILLLADTAFRNLRADIIGTLRETFDLTDISGTVRPSVERWLSELR